MDINVKLIDEKQLEQLNLDQNSMNIIKAVTADEYAPLLSIISQYNSKKNEFEKIYNNNDDVRIMFFTKMLNTLYSYSLERVLINGLVNSDDNTKKYIEQVGLKNIIKSWNTFKISHNFYNSFTCYIRLFSCLESSLRELYKIVYNPSNNNFISFNKIYEPLINDNSLDQDYKNLLKLLTAIRNLIHNMGISSKTQEIIYKNKKYNFVENQIPSKDVLNLINLLDLYEKDVLDFITELFKSSTIKSISKMQDNLSTNIEDYKKWLSSEEES